MDGLTAGFCISLSDLLDELAEAGVPLEDLAEQTGGNLDPFDVAVEIAVLTNELSGVSGAPKRYGPTSNISASTRDKYG